MHEHETLIEAARCAMPYGAGWYVIAVENGTPRPTAKHGGRDRQPFPLWRTLELVQTLKYEFGKRTSANMVTPRRVAPKGLTG